MENWVILKQPFQTLHPECLKIPRLLYVTFGNIGIYEIFMLANWQYFFLGDVNNFWDLSYFEESLKGL